MELALNVLLLPLLGGYIIVTRLNLTAYVVCRYSGQRMLLAAATCGVGLLVIARLAQLGLNAVGKGGADATWLPPLLVYNTAVLFFVGLVGHAGSGYQNFRLTGVSPEAKRFGQSTSSRWLLVVGLGAILLAQRLYFGATGAHEKLLTIHPATILIPTLLLFALCGALSAYTRLTEYAIALRLGFFLLLMTLTITIAISYAYEVISFWEAFAPFAFSSEAALAFVFGLVGWYPLNLLIPYEAALERQIIKHRHGFDKLLYYSAGTGHNIQVNLISGKVYVGKAEWIAPNPRADDGYFRIVPILSGYRDPTTKEFVPTTYYDLIYKAIIKRLEDDGDDLTFSDFAKVIPTHHVETASKFDEDVYDTISTIDDAEEVPPGSLA